MHALLEILRMHVVSVLVVGIVGVKLWVHAELAIVGLQLLLEIAIGRLKIGHSLVHLHILHMRRSVRTRSAILHVRRVRAHRLVLILM